MATSSSLKTSFLVLAPVTSESFPTHEQQKSRSSSTSSTDSVDATKQVLKSERSSSMSSNNSATISRRFFLKLGPVHDGGDPNESDFVEAV